MILTSFYAYLIFYCVLHSLLADEKLMGGLYRKWWYRIFYITQSAILLIPIYFFYFNINNYPVFNPYLPIKIFLFMLWLGALVFGSYAAKSYDNKVFFGITQMNNYLKEGKSHSGSFTEFTTNGALKYVRHPYYFTGLVLLWSRPLNNRDIPVNIVFTAYFIIGAFNEERKLKKIYGQKYLDYCKDVPMLVPALKIKKGDN